MELMNWIFAAVALGVGLLLGELGGRLTRSALNRPGIRESLASSSDMIGKIVFWSSLLIGLILAAGILSPDTLETFAGNLGDQVPRLLLAGAWLIGGYAASLIVATMVGQSALKATGVRQLALERTLRLTIVAASAAAALNQAGVDPNIVVAVVCISITAPALTLVLLSVFGGRQVAAQVAAGRVLRHHLHIGDSLTSMGQTGRVVALHSTCVAVEAEDGSTLQMPNSQLLEVGFQVRTKQRSPRV